MKNSWHKNEINYYFSTYALQPLRLTVRSGLDVPTFVTRRLHACRHARATQRRKVELWARNVGREFCLNADLNVTFRDLLHDRKATTWDRRLYFPSVGKSAEEFFAPKNPTVSAGCEPVNLGTKGQHATLRPPNLGTKGQHATLRPPNLGTKGQHATSRPPKPLKMKSKCYDY